MASLKNVGNAMSKWIEKYRSLSGELKLFIITCLLFGVATLGTTLYCYVRVLNLDTKKSTETPNQ